MEWLAIIAFLTLLAPGVIGYYIGYFVCKSKQENICGNCEHKANDVLRYIRGGEGSE